MTAIALFKAWVAFSANHQVAYAREVSQRTVKHRVAREREDSRTQGLRAGAR